LPAAAAPTRAPTALPTVAPTRAPAATAAPQVNTAQALPTVATSASASDPGFLRAVELDLDLQQPLTDQVSLKQFVEGIQQLDGVTAVQSDGVRVIVNYDSQRVLPQRIRDRLRELGHPARAGTDVQNPGDAAD
jgi:copper chaperone CopZ